MIRAALLSIILAINPPITNLSEPGIVIIHHHEWIILTARIRSRHPQWAWKLDNIYTHWRRMCPDNKYMQVDMTCYKELSKHAFE